MTFAGNLLQTDAIEDSDLPPRVGDQPILLQRVLRDGYACSPNAQHQREEILR